MKNVLTVTALLIGLFVSANAVADQTATKDECIVKCHEAAALVNAKGLEEAVKVIGDPTGPFVWKDSYVFVYSCEAGFADVAHPVPATKQSRIGDNRDATGKIIGPEFCKAAERPGGDWIEYIEYYVVEAR